MYVHAHVDVGNVLIETHVPAEVITSSNASDITLNAPTGMIWAKSSIERIVKYTKGCYAMLLAMLLLLLLREEGWRSCHG